MSHHNKEMNHTKIDFVVLWIDSNAPEWIASYTTTDLRSLFRTMQGLETGAL